jgi:DNA-binding transcriptional MerR regulator
VVTVHHLQVRPDRRLSHEEFARRSGVHPEQLRRLVALGLVVASRDARGELSFPVDQLAAVRRIERLRAELSINYAALGLVVELLDRIGQLELALRRQRAAHDATRGWIS